MRYLDAFIDMLDAYKAELGDTFPWADPKSVMLVLRECNKPLPKSQKQIAEATGIPQPNVAKLMKKMTARGWLTKPDPKATVRTVKISFSGYGMLDSFEKACQRAVKSASKVKAPST
jgi:DNA-binding MarR family transcriptional regulator